MSFLDSDDDASSGSALARLLAGLGQSPDPDPLAQVRQTLAQTQFPADGGGLFGAGYAQQMAQDLAARLAGPAVGSEFSGPPTPMADTGTAAPASAVAAAPPAPAAPDRAADLPLPTVSDVVVTAPPRAPSRPAQAPSAQPAPSPPNLWQRIEDFIHDDILQPGRQAVESVHDMLVPIERIWLDHQPRPTPPRVARGTWAGGSAEGGVLIAGGGGQGQVSTMDFPNGQRAAFATAGGFAGGPGWGRTWPATPISGGIMDTQGGAAAGLSAGVATGINFSNVTNPQDLQGASTGYNLTLGPVVGGLSFDGKGHYLGNVGLGAGWPPKLGFSFSEYPTYSRIIRLEPIPVEPK